MRGCGVSTSRDTNGIWINLKSSRACGKRLANFARKGKGARYILPRKVAPMQKLHLVMGGRVKDPQSLEFVDTSAIDVVGVFDSYDLAEEAWRASAQRTVDDAEMKYVVVHLHRLLEPEQLKRP